MIVHRDGQRLFGVRLANDVLIEKILDLPGAGDRVEQWLAGRQFPLFLADDVVGQIDAIRTDVYVAWSLDHRPDISGRLAAEATSGDAPAAEATGRVIASAGRVLSTIAAVAWAICIGHRLAFLIRHARRACLEHASGALPQNNS